MNMEETCKDFFIRSPRIKTFYEYIYTTAQAIARYDLAYIVWP